MPSDNPRSILYPVDFSEQSRHALRWAAAFAARFGSRLTVVSVVDPLLAEAARVRLGQDLATEETEPALREFVATFLDTFRYLDQLGRLAKQQVKVVMHNTLAASDYSLLDEASGFTPKPNYWGALLWRRLMGETVLESGVPVQAGLHVYAHCLRNRPGGVALLAINTDKSTARTLTLPAAERYTLSAPGGNTPARRVHLNGVELALGPNDELPEFKPEATAEGAISLAPATITFLAISNAANAACR